MLKKEQVEFLDSKIMDFFPESGSWSSICFQKSEEIAEVYLPCHLRDVNWLSQMIIKEYNITNMNAIEVSEYINKSDLFKQARHDYEQRIVTWQINFMYSGGEGWIGDNKLGGDLWKLGPYCDYAFRKGIVDTLLAINMDITAIEEGIEKNAEKWRETFIRLAFHNIYNPHRYALFGMPRMSNPSEEHMKLWMKMRLYEYYQNHKSSIEDYGIVNEEMKMTQEEVNELEEKLNKMNEERQKELDEYKETYLKMPPQTTQVKEIKQEKVEKPKGLRKVFKKFYANNIK